MRIELTHLIAIALALIAAIGALWAALRASEKKRADDAAAAVKQRGDDVREMVTAVMDSVAALNALRAVCETQRVEHATLLLQVTKLTERIDAICERLDEGIQTLQAGRDAMARTIRDDVAALANEVRGVLAVAAAAANGPRR